MTTRELASSLASPQAPAGVGMLDLFVGTAYLALGEYLRIMQPHVAVVSDVQGELDRVVIDPAFADRVHFIPVGRGHTLHTLFSDATPAQQSVIADLPGSPARYGLSRIRVAGGVAFTTISRGEEFQRLARQQVIPQLLYQVGGACNDVRLNARVGMGGGTGSLGGLVATRAHIDALLLDTDANIDVHVHLIGAITFNSPGFDRCRENAAAALVDWLDFARHPIHPRVTVVLHLTELVPVGTDKTRRDHLAIDGIQAALAPQIEREHYLQASNATFSGEFGNVRLMRTGHFRALPARRVATDAAAKYQPDVERALQTRPDLGSVGSLNWYLESAALPHESAEGLLERVAEASVDELVASALAPPARHDATVKLRLKDGRTLDLSDAAATFATPLTTVRQTSQRIGHLKTSRCVLMTERRDLRALVDELQGAIDVATKRLQRAILDAQGTTWRGLLRNDVAKTRRLHAAIVALHALVTEWTETEAKLAAAQAALAKVRELLDQLCIKLKRLRRLLRRCTPQGDSRRLPAVILPAPVDDFWKQLLGFAENPQAEVACLERLLAEAVRFVLPEGLAAIVGATDATFDAIVRSANAKTNMTIAPAWGGRERDEPGSNWLVYPPVHPRTAKALVEHHTASAVTPPQIAFARTALGSVNVVSLEYRYCQRRDDAWTVFYQQGYARALASERHGFYIIDPAAAARLGIAPAPANGKPTKR